MTMTFNANDASRLAQAAKASVNALLLTSIENTIKQEATRGNTGCSIDLGRKPENIDAVMKDLRNRGFVVSIRSHEPLSANVTLIVSW